MLDNLTHASFENLEDKSFEIDFGDAGKQTATLERTSGFSEAAPKGHREPFSVFLRVKAPAEQQIYTVHHRELGVLDLFLVPLEENEEGVLFEAVFT